MAKITMSSVPIHDFAYTWLFMKGDAYLPGIFTSVHSVLRTDPTADLVVMVTEDVSEHARAIILKVATHICTVPYLTFESKPLKTERQRELYDKWITSSYTKWNALALPYRKVVLLDGDIIHTDNTDSLFNLQTPAMSFNSPFNKPVGNIPSYWKGPKGKDGYLLHGSCVSYRDIIDVLHKGGILPTASPVVLSPNITDYEEYIKLIKSMEPFGFMACNNGHDEQSICWYYSEHKKQDWISVHHRYNLIGWKNGFLHKGDIPYCIHYFSEKPWRVAYDTYEDVISWYKMANDAIEKAHIKPEDINLTEVNTTNAKLARDSFIKKHINVNSVLDIIGKISN